MKNRILVVAVLQFILVLGSCSSDSVSQPEVTIETPAVVIKTVKVTSYSKNSGETGETITMFGENFSGKVSDIKITFDGVPATVVAATTTEIKFTLPETAKVLPKIVVTIMDKEILNEVKNDYDGNIGILPTRSLTNWVVQENTFKFLVDGIYPCQLISDKIMYVDYSKTLDGGVSWELWSDKAFSGYHVTANGDGWASYVNGLWKVSDGVTATDPFESTKGNTCYTVFVEDNMQNGTIISQRGLVLTTTNGKDFVKEYQSEGIAINLYTSSKIDNNHIWGGGYKTVKHVDDSGYERDTPFILYKNNATDGWKEYTFNKEAAGYLLRSICFVNPEIGFVMLSGSLSKILKTTNGGDSWSQVYDAQKFYAFTFKDANTGWALLENKIYKTTNGGTEWTLDYTHDQKIEIIEYKNNVVWAIATNKIIKRYL